MVPRYLPFSFIACGSIQLRGPAQQPSPRRGGVSGCGCARSRHHFHLGVSGDNYVLYEQSNHNTKLEPGKFLKLLLGDCVHLLTEEVE